MPTFVTHTVASWKILACFETANTFWLLNVWMFEHTLIPCLSFASLYHPYSDIFSCIDMAILSHLSALSTPCLYWYALSLPHCCLSSISWNLQPMTSEVTTLPSHQNYNIAISKSTKKRVWDVDPNGGCCLVENTTRSVEYCHCIPRRIMKERNIVCVYRIHPYLFCIQIS